MLNHLPPTPPAQTTKVQSHNVISRGLAAACQSEASLAKLESLEAGLPSASSASS